MLILCGIFLMRLTFVLPDQCDAFVLIPLGSSFYQKMNFCYKAYDGNLFSYEDLT